MDFYLKIESFQNEVSKGSGVVVYDADNLVDAVRKAAVMVESNPPVFSSGPFTPDVEERITIGAVHVYSLTPSSS